MKKVEKNAKQREFMESTGLKIKKTNYFYQSEFQMC